MSIILTVQPHKKVICMQEWTLHFYFYCAPIISRTIYEHHNSAELGPCGCADLAELADNRYWALLRARAAQYCHTDNKQDQTAPSSNTSKSTRLSHVLTLNQSEHMWHAFERPGFIATRVRRQWLRFLMEILFKLTTYLLCQYSTVLYSLYIALNVKWLDEN
jgi:hypothetical protein